MADSTTIKVIIADDHDIYLDGLKLLLSRDASIEVIGEASSGKDLIALVKKLQPHIVLTDLKMPGIDGIQAIKEISASGSATKCIAISTFDSDYLIIEALEAGAMGYINKNVQKGEIIEAIKSVYEDHPYYSSFTSKKLALKIAKTKLSHYSKMNPFVLNDKEKEIVRLICQEKTNEEIGHLLFMSRRTVEAVRARILERTNIKSTIGLVIFAIATGIYVPEY